MGQKASTPNRQTQATENDTWKEFDFTRIPEWGNEYKNVASPVYEAKALLEEAYTIFRSEGMLGKTKYGSLCKRSYSIREKLGILIIRNFPRIRPEDEEVYRKIKFWGSLLSEPLSELPQMLYRKT
ncbi:hypothetical protein GLAREA_09445 [Glarea lozoyensis ATCC 20868]|uniref:Uncharacterized protein n=1 Tax=Glarea lozoyensis (strain ATCC 20868 / MF5171) TaxID=1116229 RepID=S3CRP6_GLAL2|nr:uncharacterized protein GLAREA_09445 [Glarea lozoyensis ATCC 20868]EPE28325.1 hypothetical protein GLAREA_09445 [Glarea lozoyensis ATCC 20868]